MRKYLHKFACLACIALLLTGCWAEEPPEQEDAFFIPDVTEDPAEPDVVLPRTFSLPYDAAQTLDPITCSDGMQQVVGSLLYEGLFQLDPQLEPQPRLCSGYSYDSAAYTYTFTLRSGVTFSDGSPLTGADVAATLRRAVNSTRYGARLNQVSSISYGENTVTVALSSANAHLPALLDIPIVKLGTEENLIPLGTGAYCYTADDGGSPSLIPNPHWWGGDPLPVQEISLIGAADRETMLYQFTSHEVQLITADLTGTDSITATGNISFEDADTTVLQYIGFNTRRAVFQNPAVRRALGLGINRATLASAILSGHAEETQFPISPVSVLYPEGLEEAYSYDSFSSAMSAAGCSTGAARTVTLLVNAENSFKVSAAQYIAESLSEFDIKIQVEALPWVEYTAALAAGRFDLYYGEVRLTADWNLSSLLGTGGALNYGGWTDPQMDQHLASIVVADDQTAAVEAACAYLQEQAPILPLCFKSTSVLYQTGVLENLTPTMTEPFYDLASCVIHLREQE